eukprot:ANDGO_01330.mRNA.1 hypothetical protein
MSRADARTDAVEKVKTKRVMVRYTSRVFLSQVMPVIVLLAPGLSTPETFLPTLVIMILFFVFLVFTMYRQGKSLMSGFFFVTVVLLSAYVWKHHRSTSTVEPSRIPAFDQWIETIVVAFVPRVVAGLCMFSILQRLLGTEVLWFECNVESFQELKTQIESALPKDAIPVRFFYRVAESPFLKDESSTNKESSAKKNIRVIVSDLPIVRATPIKLEAESVSIPIGKPAFGMCLAVLSPFLGDFLNDSLKSLLAKVSV